MSRIVAIGERERLRGLALSGVGVIAADDPEAVRAAWTGLSEDVALVILTAEAGAALELAERGERLSVVMPG